PWLLRDAAPDTAEAREKRAKAALARVASIEPKLAKVRELAFLHEVPTVYQSLDDFRAYLEREIAKDLPPGKARDQARAYRHIGLFAKDVDLAAAEEQMMESQAAAYYDPEVKKFFLVMVPDSDLMLDTISAHELTHGLQDQHFDLTHFLEPRGRKLDQDAETARRFVAEGDATLAMLVYAIVEATGKDSVPPAMMAMIATQVHQLASQDLASFAETTRKQSALLGGMDADIQHAVDAMAELPPAVLEPLVASYTKGAEVALVAYQHGGWAAVDQLYRDPPESTEQVLHPDTKLYPREHPHRVTLAAPPGRELEADVLGELLWQVYFQLWVPPRAIEASEGWGGDRFDVYERKDGRLIGRIATVWDTTTDATQFADAYLASLAARFPGAAKTADGVVRPDGGKVMVRTIGAKVLIVDGGDDDTALDQLARDARFE
ncbi:MAG TPA: hypothetical protein VLX92_26280, partial [Kofleriaceae bacterium]|nr:hypothetical protein [Kofleriaceae bacterium]